MPLTRIVCPHCEQSVEVQTTSVTRSRECPACGKSIIMQMASRDRKARRKALLTEATELDGEAADAGGDVSPPAPRELTGDPVKRLMHDPEVQTRVAYLKWGLVFFGAMILLTVLGNTFHWWSNLGEIGERISYVLRGSPPKDQGAQVSEALSGSPKPTVPGEGGRIPRPVEPARVSEPSLPGPRLTDQETAKDAVAKFLEARSVEERLQVVRDRSLNERRMRAYYEKHGDGPIAYERIEALDVNPQGVFTYSFSVVLPDGTRRGAMAGKVRSGEYLVDWASFVLYSEMEWSEFRSKRPKTGTMFRLLVEPADFYAGTFSDQAGLLCLKLANPADRDAAPVYGYIQRSLSLGRVLAGIMERNATPPVPMMLKLAYPETPGAENQVLITEFIGEGWIARNW